VFEDVEPPCHAGVVDLRVVIPPLWRTSAVFEDVEPPCRAGIVNLHVLLLPLSSAVFEDVEAARCACASDQDRLQAWLLALLLASLLFPA
jgi:hypothetical protein